MSAFYARLSWCTSLSVVVGIFRDKDSGMDASLRQKQFSYKYGGC